MAMFIALPIFLTILYAALLPIRPIPIPGGNSFLLLIGPIFFALFLSLSSIGAEGDALWNIYSSPVQEKEITKAKFAFVLLPSLVILFAVIGVLIVLTQLSIGFLVSFTIVAMCLIVESIMVGLAIGSRYPDFRVMPRTRFFRPMGLLIVFLLYGVVAFATMVPSIIYVIFELQLLIVPLILLITIIMTSGICYFMYRSTLSGVSTLLQEYPI
jgi:heme A synthase